MGFRVSELLRQPEVDDVYLITTFTDAHQEIVGLDITVNEVTGVNILHT